MVEAITHMLFGTNLTRRAQREQPIVLVVVRQKKVARSRFVADDHYSCAIFVLISMLRGQTKTPPSGDDLAVLDYHLNQVVFSTILYPCIYMFLFNIKEDNRTT